MYNNEKNEILFELHIVVEPDGDQFHAYCPALKGLHVPGETIEEAFENAKDAAILYLMSLIKHGDPIPLGVRIPEKKARPFWACWESRQQERVENIALALA
jgi:predicted RNase H-like HicB family nuclease